MAVGSLSLSLSVFVFVGLFTGIVCHGADESSEGGTVPQDSVPHDCPGTARHVTFIGVPFLEKVVRGGVDEEEGVSEEE